MRVLFIGGTGNISTSVSRLAVERGHELYLLNRGNRDIDIPGAKSITADINEPDKVRKALGDLRFDTVVNWIAFAPSDIERDIELFTGRTDQYIFISSASVYQKPATTHIITESTPLVNPHWEYSRNKIACEDRLMLELRERGFPITIVRPSLTYGDQLIPLVINSWNKSYTAVDRIKRGKKVIVPGDGNSLWTITHSDDFAKGFVGLLGNQRAIGHAFHITSDEVLTWNQIYNEVGRAVGVEPKIVHIASDTIAKFYPWEEGSLHGDKAVSAVFDNAKIKSFVPDFTATITWAEGMRRAIAWYEAEPGRIQIDDESNASWDKTIEAYERILA
ncbi:MAG: NAD-dependent epimerase/dehydratase family protein [Chitinivibrionales bacterium]|nr:NAD-dependent epimerase/dehydratase family protein [Chitinivibrionales bacterium]